MLREVAIVAGHELSESLRSRRILIFALLYVGGAVAGAHLFVQLLQGFEAMLADSLKVAEAARPGVLTQAAMRSEQAQALLTRLLGDRELSSELTSIPPLALFYGWMTVTFCPALVMLTASECFASELASGAIRFSLVRVDRLSYSAGKLAGQGALVAMSILAGALGVAILGSMELADFSWLESGLWSLRLSGRGLAYCMAYVGLAVGLSHLTRSVAVARVLGLTGLVMTSALWSVGRLDWTQEQLGWLGRPLLLLLPQSHMVDLFRPQLVPRLSALLMLGTLAVLYFSAGYWLRTRRDV